MSQRTTLVKKMHFHEQKYSEHKERIAHFQIPEETMYSFFNQPHTASVRLYANGALTHRMSLT